jgi:hypothetical protein
VVVASVVAAVVGMVASVAAAVGIATVMLVAAVAATPVEVAAAVVVAVASTVVVAAAVVAVASAAAVVAVSALRPGVQKGCMFVVRAEKQAAMAAMAVLSGVGWVAARSEQQAVAAPAPEFHSARRTSVPQRADFRNSNNSPYPPSFKKFLEVSITTNVPARVCWARTLLPLLFLGGSDGTTSLCERSKNSLRISQYVR